MKCVPEGRPAGKSGGGHGKREAEKKSACIISNNLWYTYFKVATCVVKTTAKEAKPESRKQFPRKS